MTRCSFLPFLAIMAAVFFGAALGQTGSCPALASVALANPQCTVVQGCGGLQCDLNVTVDGAPVTGYARFAVWNCVDPVAVEVTVMATVEGTPQMFVMNFTESSSVDVISQPFQQSVSMSVTIATNFSSDDVTFSAVFAHPSFTLIEIIPPAPVSLNSADCMCASLTDLAQVINTVVTPFEHNCSPNSKCDGVRCELSIGPLIDDTYFIEFIALPCATPPAMEVLVEDSSLVPLGQWIFDQTGSSVIFVQGLSITVRTVVNHFTRSFEVESSLQPNIPTIDESIQVFPPHTIILDLSSCTAVPPEFCQTIVEATDRNPECEPLGGCVGIQCRVRESQVVNGRASAFVVNKCVDPFTVQLELVNEDTGVTDVLRFSRLGNQSAQFDSNGLPVFADLSFNPQRDLATFEASVTQNSVMVPVIPEFSVPLNSSTCMCDSITDLVTTINNFDAPSIIEVEHDCTVNDECDGFICELSIAGITFYSDIIILPCTNPPSVELLVESFDRQPLAVAVFDETGSQVIMPVSGINITIIATVDHLDRSLSMSVSLFNDIIGTIELFPLHTIILDKIDCPLYTADTEQCQSLLAADDLYPQCEPLGNCTGMRCEVREAVLNGRAAFSIQKCRDPVGVQISYESSDGGTFYGTVVMSQTVTISGYPVSMVVSRQDRTDLFNFEATVNINDVNLPFLPSSTVPLNSSFCMCSSLKDLAAMINSLTFPFEHDCTVNPLCDGVTCELNILLTILRIEAIIDPCEDPPAVNILIEDAFGTPLFTYVFTQSGTVEGDILGFEFTLEATIVHYDYSIEAEVILRSVLAGDLDVVPQSTVQLDKSSCRLSAPAQASQTCLLLYETANRAAEPLVCDVTQTSDVCSGLQCVLSADAEYSVSIQLLPCLEEKPAVLISVARLGGGSIYSNTTSEYVVSQVALDAGVSTFLYFEVDPDDKGVALLVQLIRSVNRITDIDTLIPYTLIPYDFMTCSTSETSFNKTTLAITVAIIGAIVLVIIIAVILGTIWLCLRHRKNTEAFDFQSFRDLQAKENAAEEKPEEGTDGATNVYEAAPSKENGHGKGNDSHAQKDDSHGLGDISNGVDDDPHSTLYATDDDNATLV